MDNEALVDKIVRSLSFEVVAVPQTIIPVDSTSKSTPLNVKVKVRKKQGAGLRHGVLSMPKVDTSSEYRKEAPERVRLVSSDQTIMNFDMLMEADFDKVVTSQMKLNMILPDSDKLDVAPPLTKNVDEMHTSIFTKKNKDIFGRCKPGGCLDPPFGEDKYLYKPAKQNLSQVVKDDSTKLRSSSIFKYNIFKRKRKSSQSDDQLNITDQTNKNEIESTTDLYGTASIQTSTQYSNSIITYPHPSDSNEFYKQGEKKLSREEDKSFVKRYSNDEKSKSSSIDDGSYFILPKKKKNLSNQSGLNKTHKTDLNPSENNLNIIQLKKEANLDDKVLLKTVLSETLEGDKINESNLTSQDASFIPIPLIVPLNAIISDTYPDKEEVAENKAAEIKPTDNIFESNDAIQKRVITNNQTDILETSNYQLTDHGNTSQENLSGTLIPEKEKKFPTKDNENGAKEGQTQDRKSIISTENLKIVINDRNHSKIYGMRTDFDDNIILEKEINKNITNTNEPDLNVTESNLEHSGDFSEVQIDHKSHPLVARAREKSIINITNELAEVNENVFLKLPEQESFVQSTVLSSGDLSQIWENKTEPLKSMADVIFKNSVPLAEGNEINISSKDKIQNFMTNLFSDNMKSIIENPNLKTRNQSSNSFFQLEHDKEQNKKQFMYKNPFSEEMEAISVISSIAHGKENTTDKRVDSLEKQQSSNSNIDVMSLKAINRDNELEAAQENLTNDEAQNGDSETRDNKDTVLSETQEVMYQNLETIHINKESITSQPSFNNKDFTSLDTANSIKSVTSSFVEKSSKQSKNSNTVLQVDAIKSYEQFESAKINLESTSLEFRNVFHVDEVVGINKLPLKEVSEISKASFFENDSATIEDLTQHKKVQSASVVSLIESQRLSYIANEVSENEDIRISSDNDLTETANLHNERNHMPDETAFKQTHQLISDNDTPKLTDQVKNTENASHIVFKLNEQSSNIPVDLCASFISQPATILRKTEVPWKMDIALQSYTDENNERVIKSFDSGHTPPRRQNDAFLVARCYLGSDTNEINIPIDQDNDLSVKITHNISQKYPSSDLYHNSRAAEDSFGNKKNVQVSDEVIKEEIREQQQYTLNTYNEDTNKSEINKYNKEKMSEDLRNVLNTIYEEELVPLQTIIKGLREEIDALAAYQIKFKRSVLKPIPQRSRPIRLVHSDKRCVCYKNL